MGGISIIVLVLTAIVLTSGQIKNMGGNMTPPWIGFASRDIKYRLRIKPAPMPGFNVNAWLGPWFYQFRKSPCNWGISDDFTDHSQILERRGKVLLLHETSRVYDMCNKVTSLVTVTGTGHFSGKDLGGDNWSGQIILVATDYKRFSITWGCTKWSTFDQTCDDPWLYVKTRQLKVSNDVMSQIESVLQKVFGISVNELTRVRHVKPCPRGSKLQG